MYRKVFKNVCHSCHSAIVQDYQGFSLEKGASVSVHPGSVGTRWRGRTDYVNRMDGKIQLL